MNKFVPRGYLPLKEALKYFGRRRETAKLSDIGREALDHELENTEKASSKQEFQQLLFEETVPAKLFIGGRFFSLESSIWGTVETERIFETEQASRSVGNEYFPDVVYGRVLIKQSSIDALFDDDSDDPSQSSKGETAKTGTGDAGLIDDDVPASMAETKGEIDAVDLAASEQNQKRQKEGRPSRKEEIITAYEKLRDAKEVDFAARNVISKAGYGKNFGHSLGHGIGLEVHELPVLSARSKTILKAGMVVTVEPGIYLPGVGGVRIEDDVLITDDGCRVMSSYAKDPAAAVIEPVAGPAV